MGKLVLIDGNSIAFRAFYALPLLTNATGTYTNAVYGFTMMLLKVLEEEKPTHLLVAFDAGKTTFRHNDYQKYKGKREKTPGELSEQIPLIKEVLDAFQIRSFELEGYEADDIIGTLAHSPEAEGLETLIVSGDKDLLQLVNDHVQVLMTRKGVTETERYDVKAVDERYGLTPGQIIDLKGLMGDPSDNIPGIPGVGEKTALKLLHQFPTVEEIIEHADELPGKKLQEKVREHADQALLSKKLATIYTEVPLEFGVSDLKLPPTDLKKVSEVFKKLEFKTLLNRIHTGGETGEEVREAEPEQISYQIVTADHRDETEKVLKQDQLAVYVEMTEENPHRAEVTGIAVSDGKAQLYIPMETARHWEAFQAWLADGNRRKIVYDVKKTMVSLENKGFQTDGFQFDVLLAAYLLNPSESRYELSDMVERHLQGFLPSDEEVYGKGAKRRALEGEELARHLARKTSAICQLYPVLLKELEQADLYDLMCGLEMPLAGVLAGMEQQGVRVDKKRLDDLGIELKESMDRLTDEIYEIAGVEFNINSPKQLGEILFDKLGLPVLKKTKTGYSTSADVLERLAPQHEIVEKILHYRQVGKLYSTYIEGLKKEIGRDGKIHTQFHQTITATGRLSSTEPNLQNIPIRLEEGRRIRQVFVPSKEGWYMLAADYSQVELRVLAHLSEDESLQYAFKHGLDIHTQTAMDVFGVSETEVTPLMRRHAKAVNFGIVYGISDFGLSQNLNITRKEAKDFIDRYFETYPGVKRYMDTVVKQAKKEGFVTTLLGRRRYLPDINSRNFNLRSFAERTAMNTPIQGTAADIIKYAMVEMDKRMKEEKLESRMLLQVHDELIFEVPEEELPVMRTLVPEVMEGALPLSVPLQVDVNVGKSWYEAK
ncbi:DNA polymerase I [Paenactinomyces guangxiensis]|uniref:DNA polymerase I n=1 Tax=Paenactinomyces guangxiensis TaxID=1490290 RepID=A0A7W1WUU6_9BACL|nr:DNA polymerase I [Paenactinomyces guangxiensis]MBA4496465.1 DNA polymerase I [Paenactinomyces guangxiensis]MBH8593581.1 DNA polymerase I [Paenactinomyces guangxiensis]